jgi:NodT family efflux transporter outer membrane factor (OMF) lipoprotein
MNLRKSLVSAVLLLACAMPVSAKAREAVAAALDQAKAGLADGERQRGQGWWDRMGDPQLADLVARALAGNLDIEQAAAQLQRAKAAASAARAELLPQFGLGASAAARRLSLEDPAIRPFASQPGFPRDIERYEAGVSASWELDLFGGGPRQRAARAQSQAAAADLAAVHVAIAAETATAWYNLVELQARLAIAEQRRANLQRQEAAFELRADAGIIARLDVDRFAAETRSAEAAVALLTALRVAEAERLGVLINDAAHARALAGEPHPLPTLPDQPAIAALPVTLAARPDVIAAGRRLESAGAYVAAVKAQRLPRVQLGALLATIAAAPATLFTAPALAASASAGLAMPLFDFGRIDAAINDARATERAALAAYRQSVLYAAADVEAAVATFGARQRQEALLGDAAGAANRAYLAAKANHAAGASDLTTLLDVERSSFAASEAHALAKTAAARALVSLSRATAGWPEQDVASAELHSLKVTGE